MNKLKMSLKLKIKIPTNNEIKPCQKTESTPIVDNRNSIDEVYPNIYISGYQIANDQNFLLQNNFTHIINCSCGSSMDSGIRFHSPEIKYLSIYLRDDPSIDIIHNILQAIDFIENDSQKNLTAPERKTKVLFHCIEGVSRGPALAAGYLMWKFGMDKVEAIRIISEKRKCVDINLGFSVQLSKWEKYLKSLNDEVSIFKLSEGIKLLDENEFKEENIYEGEYLFRFKGKFILIKPNELYSEESKNQENFEVPEFVKNIQKYDKKSKLLETKNIDYFDNLIVTLCNKNKKNKINDFISFFKENIVQY